MQKYSSADIKPFEFSEIKSDHVVTQSKFENFTFKDIDGKPFNAEDLSEATIRQERAYEQQTDFRIDSTVRELRGLNRQQQNDTEQQIQNEVKKRLDKAYQDAYKEGLEKGRIEGQAEALKKFEASSAVKIDELSNIIAEVKIQADELLANNKQETIEFVKRFTKWIVLKEVSDKNYLTSLLEKLILELNVRRNLIIKVSKENFSQMPEVISVVESKLGQLSNVRVEIVSEIKHPGIILEGENGLIDGSLEGVFDNIDKIFEQVMVNE